VCSLIAFVNFATTTDGMTDLFWNALFEIECDDVDRKRMQLLASSPQNCQTLRNYEANMIAIMSNAGRDVLEDNPAIDTFQATQRTSIVIEALVAATEKTERQIQQFKARFCPVTERVTLLYDCVVDVGAVDPIDQFSLPWSVPPSQPSTARSCPSSTSRSPFRS
jgi:hypothetical protein